MHRITHQTAQTLKAAGFPQPPFQIGQIWYNQTGIQYLITGLRGLFPYVKRIDAENWSKPLLIFEWEGWSYAASATEILPDKYSLNNQFGAWKCYRLDKKHYYPEYINDNPAEAAANAYMFTINQ